jgi:hypothetical protein
MGANDTSIYLLNHQNHRFTEPSLRENPNFFILSSPLPISHQSLGCSNGSANFFYAHNESQSDFIQVLNSGSAQQQYACQMCNFYSHNPKAIFSHIKSEIHLNQGMPLLPPLTPSQLPWFYNPSSSIPHLAVGLPLRNANDIRGICIYLLSMPHLIHSKANIYNIILK